MTHLFSKLTIRDLEIPNRIWIAPMCQYSCVDQDGMPNDWHLVHLGAFANGGFGLIITEASAVSPEGRISPQDAGIWSDEQADAWSRVVDYVHGRGAKIGMQLAHAGRKASTHRNFPDEKSGIASEAEGGWPVVGPSADSFPGYDNVPEALDDDGIRKVIADFRAAAERAIHAGFDVLEIHAAHGYLLHQFLSPLSNTRTDAWGGDLEGRSRLLIAIVDSIREIWGGPLFVRISATDWVDNGWNVEQSIALARMIKQHGVDLIDVSSGGNAPADIPIGPGYQVDFASQIRDQADIATGAVGLITDPRQAEDILAGAKADAIFVARVALREPHWPQRAAFELGLATDDAPYQPQHVRGAWRS